MAAALVLMAAALPVYAAGGVSHGTFDFGTVTNPCNPSETGPGVLTGTTVTQFSTDGAHFTTTSTGSFVFGPTNLGLTWVGHLTMWNGGNVNAQGTWEGTATLSGHFTSNDGQSFSFTSVGHMTQLADGRITVAFNVEGAATCHV